MREIITLACGECKRRNYSTTKNKKTVPDRIELKKYCKFCKSHMGETLNSQDRHPHLAQSGPAGTIPRVGNPG